MCMSMSIHRRMSMCVSQAHEAEVEAVERQVSSAEEELACSRQNFLNLLNAKKARRTPRPAGVAARAPKACFHQSLHH